MSRTITAINDEGSVRQTKFLGVFDDGWRFFVEREPGSAVEIIDNDVYIFLPKLQEIIGKRLLEVSGNRPSKFRGMSASAIYNLALNDLSEDLDRLEKGL